MLSGALAVFVLVTLDVLLGGPLTALDGVLSRWVRTTGLPGRGWNRPGQRELDLLVNFGDPEVVAVILVVVLALVCWQARTLLPFLRLAVVGALTIGTVWTLKVIIARPAPSGVSFEDALRSYPSGHTATSVVLWGLLAAVVADYRPRSVSLPVVEVLSWLAPLLTMTGLLLRDYHWLSDLIAGAAVGVVLVQIERLALRHWRDARRGSGPAESAGGAHEAEPAGGAREVGPAGGAREVGPAGAREAGPAGGAREAARPTRGSRPLGAAGEPDRSDPARGVPAPDRADTRRGG